MKERFIDKRFNKASLSLIAYMNQVIANYQRQGYDLSLRQLYYRLVAANVVPNTEKSYKRVGSILSDARMAGLVDWNVIVDRGRVVHRNSHWNSPADIVRACADSFQYDKWEHQPWRVIVMVEKQALEGVLIPVCRQLDVSFMSNKGYSSTSAMYKTGKVIASYMRSGQNVRIVYLGDHDPSGMNMTDDVRERLSLFCDEFEHDAELEIHRVALNMDQIKRYNPPPNPVKFTDTRADGYVMEFGTRCWELDALEPSQLAELVRNSIIDVRDEEQWSKDVQRERDARNKIKELANNMDKAVRTEQEDQYTWDLHHDAIIVTRLIDGATLFIQGDDGAELYDALEACETAEQVNNMIDPYSEQFEESEEDE